MARLTPRTSSVAQEIIGRYPRSRSAAHPAAAPGPGTGRLRHRRRHGAHRRAGRRHPGRGARHLLVLRDVQARAGRAATWSTSAPTSPASSWAARSCSTTPRRRSASRPAAPPPTALFTLEDVECIAACTEAPCLQVNYRYFATRSPSTLRRAGRRPARRAGWPTRSRPTAPWPGSASTSPPTGRRAPPMPDGAGRARRGWPATPREGGSMTVTDAPRSSPAASATTTATP